jgi:hypothetical protein
MTDTDFLRAFNDTTLEPFHHRDHLRVTFLYLREFGKQGTLARLGPAILRYAAARNASEKYHETITVAWIHLVDASSQAAPDFEVMIAQNPRLLDKNLLNDYYSPALLKSDEARKRWIEPDLAQL